MMDNDSDVAYLREWSKRWPDKTMDDFYAEHSSRTMEDAALDIRDFITPAIDALIAGIEEDYRKSLNALDGD